jgi:hypothetical protein
MNTLLDLFGGILYLSVSIILLPMLLVLDLFMGLWMAVNYLSHLKPRLRKKLADKHPYQWQLKRTVTSLRTKLAGLH